MRLADYLEANADSIVDAAEAFVSTQRPDGLHLDRAALRDHLPQLLAAIVADLRRAQSSEDEVAKAAGRMDAQPGALSAAQSHGRLRAKAGFDIGQLVAEYRALRASVLRAWTALQPVCAESFEDMNRFNQAIDQAIAESVADFAAEAESWRQVFLGVLGHDLRGPLTAIMITSELLSKMTHDTPLSRQTQSLIESGKRMSALLDDLLDYSRTSLGMGIRITPRDTDLVAELGNEIEVLHAAWPELAIEFDAPAPVRGRFDASRLREALANLVNNAARYGTVPGRVRVALDRQDGNVVLTVRNAGSAIPAKTLATMFEPLKRGSVCTNEDVSLGLGLFVVREVAKAHGGDVSAECSGDETTFTLRLPENHRE